VNAMAEKLKEAGVDTIGARLTAACTEAIRQYPGSIAEAWRFVGVTFGHEFVRGLMKDMQRNEPQIEQTSPPVHAIGVPEQKPHQTRVIPPERLEKRRELRQVIRSKYKNSGDIAWSDVGWHELHGLKRDGVEARALLDAAPGNVPNDGRSVGEVLGVKRVDEIIGAVRK
jgi:hypothetical protein